MADKIEQGIGEELDRIVGRKGKTSHPIMMGKMVAGTLDGDNMICSVLLSADDEDAPTPGVLLNAVALDALGFVLYPADGSVVWVAEVNGPGMWGVIKCSELLQMTVNIGNAQVAVSNSQLSLNCAGAGFYTAGNGKWKIYNNTQNFFNILTDLMAALEALTVATPSGNSSVPLNLTDLQNVASHMNDLFY
jgi:hypothetical protein